MQIKIAPSILSADFSRVGEAVRLCEESGADLIHCDVMDGSFVEPITFGGQMVKSIRPLTKLPLDVHLMIEHPKTQIRFFAAAGADIITVHYEACAHLHRTVQEIHRAGMKAGVTLNPTTPVAMLEDIIADIDMVLLMSVNPGFGGQDFIENTIAKVGRLRELIDRSGSRALIEVDGGVQADTAPRLVAAGVDVLVSGSYVFKSADPEAAISSLRNLGGTVA